jgi:hypothetical protein
MAVKVCHCITNAPRIELGAASAANIGTVALLGPMPSPVVVTYLFRHIGEVDTYREGSVRQTSVASFG